MLAFRCKIFSVNSACKKTDLRMRNTCRTTRGTHAAHYTVEAFLGAFFKIATLSVQLGMDCHYYTRYYAPNYQPATGAFANQQEVKFGNYPLMNAYANLKLSKTRFYIMWSHINQGWFSSDYFSMRHYPLNPRRFQIGLSVEFTN